jgi:putative FmdB family regulatory protein
MPIYEYRCSACGHELEALQKFSDAPLSTCPSCNASALVKLVSAAGFQLKGSGWYVTDFKGGGKSAPSKDSGATPPDGKSDTKVEPKAGTTTKTETKAEAASSTPAPASGSGGTTAST